MIDDKISDDPVLISFGTELPREYAIAVEKLREDCQRHNIECDISLVPAVEGASAFERRLKAIHQKPMFIKKMLQKHRRPVMWFDVDGSIHGSVIYPELGDADILTVQNQDLKRGNADKLRMSGGLIIYPYKKRTMQLLDEWDDFCRTRSVRLCWGDHRTLEKGILEQGKYKEVDVTNHFANKWLVNSRNKQKATTDNKVLEDDSQPEKKEKVALMDGERWGHISGWLKGLDKYLRRRGFDVLSISRSENVNWWRHQLKGVSLAFIWNGAHPITRQMIEACKAEGIRHYIVEVGWFPQRRNFFIDSTGINCRSEIITDDLSWVGTRQYEKLKKLRREYIGDRKWIGGDKVLVPLQLYHDMNWVLDGPFDTTEAFIKHVGQRFGEDVVIKKHPKDYAHYSGVLEGGSFLDMTQTAKMVYGVNSTCLLEAALLGAPVKSIGGGYIRSHESNVERLLAALADKQIPVGLEELDYWLHDMLAACLDSVKGNSAVNWRPLDNSVVVVVECKNNAGEIEVLLNSITNDSNKDLGVLVIDRMSDDDTAAIARKCLKGIDHLVVRDGKVNYRDYCGENALVRIVDGMTPNREAEQMICLEPKDTISIVVSCFNQLHVLPMFLESMFFQTICPAQVIVADDGSSDGVREWIDANAEKYPFELSYVTRKHEGYRLASLENMAAGHVTASRILFTNADVIHCPQSIKTHLEKEGVAGGVVKGIEINVAKKVKLEDVRDYAALTERQQEAPSWRNNVGYMNSTDPQHNPIGVWGGNFSVSRDKFEEIGGFDEGFTGWGGEDNDLVKRLAKAGCKVSWAKESEVYHLDHETKQYSKEMSGSKRYIAGTNRG